MSLYMGNKLIANAGGGYGGRPLDYQNAILSTYTLGNDSAYFSTDTITVQKDGILISDIQMTSNNSYINGLMSSQIEWYILNKDDQPVVKWINYLTIDSSTGSLTNSIQILDHVLYVKAGQVFNIQFRKASQTARVVFINIPYLEE